MINLFSNWWKDHFEDVNCDEEIKQTVMDNKIKEFEEADEIMIGVWDYGNEKVIGSVSAIKR